MMPFASIKINNGIFFVNREGVRMSSITAVFFTIGTILIAGGIYFLLAIKKPGFYPPKYILRKRAAALGAAGIVLLLMGAFMYSLK